MSVEAQLEPLERAPGFDGRTVCEAFQRTAATFPDSVALRTLHEAAPSLTWAEYAQRVQRIAGGLAQLGVGPGDTVAMMLTNRTEFHLVDTAALHLGATPFSVYNSSSPEQIAYLFSNADNRIVITERKFEDTVRAVGAEHVVVIEDGLPDADHPDFEAAWRAVEPSTVATLIYTSGTTGPPKGVQLTHANIMAALDSWVRFFPLRTQGRVVSYLPCAHIADRFLANYISIATGSTLTSVDDPANVLAALVDTRPTGWLAVPRIWEKIKAALEAKGIADPSVLPEEAKAATRAGLGLDQADWVGSGAAPIAPCVLEYFIALGLPVGEGWAMSETGCAGTVNHPDDMRVGTVGRPLPGLEVKLADDGELLIQGPTIMAGYRKDPEKTAEAIDADGWLHTGDIAQIDADGFVKIVDRKKEIIINAAGKNMSPANIEQTIKASSPLIGQTCVIGDARPYNVALIVLDPDAAAAFEGDVEATVAAAMEEANARLSRVEQIKRYKILDTDWLPDSDELTPTMKLKRRGVHAKYAAEIEALYA